MKNPGVIIIIIIIIINHLKPSGYFMYRQL